MSIERVASRLEAVLPGRVEHNASVADLTTYRLGGPVAVLVRVPDPAALDAVADVLASEPTPVLVVGRGSNLLVADRGFPGVAVVLTGEFEALEVDAATGIVRAGAAVPLPVVGRRAGAVGVAGLEFFVGIPGSIGGAVRMNAGGHGRETADVLQRAWVQQLAAGASRGGQERGVATLDLGYRRSNLGPRDVVLRAELRGVPDDPAACEARIAEIVRWRREHQPGGANAGSVFRNPPGDSAGRIIDAAGLKGVRVGSAVVSTKHANFFQAEVGATADDVRRLVDAVRSQVKARTGVVLEPELRMVGFDDGGREEADLR